MVLDSPATQSDRKVTCPSGVFPLDAFRIQDYDNVLHKWDMKPFVVRKIRSFCGVVSEKRMESHIKKIREKIAREGGCDSEGLVLNDVCHPFRSKLLFSVCRDKVHGEKMQYLSGLWLSKVYVGDYSQFLDWVGDISEFVCSNYGKKIDPYHEFFVYYPSGCENQKQGSDPILVFFVKVGD